MKPDVGDVVDDDVYLKKKKQGTLIHKRKSQLIRPMASNVDQALVIFSVHEPEPNFLLLESLSDHNGATRKCGNHLL